MLYTYFKALGSLFFFLVSFHVLDDKREADRAICEDISDEVSATT